MITDPSHPLVRALEGAPEGVDVVYLPPKLSEVTGAEKSERVSIRPNVAAAAAMYFDDPDRLHGDRVPETTIMSERPVHRMMIYLHAQGADAKQIAAQTGYSYATVSQVLRQPWARQRLVQILNECGKDQVKHFLTSEIGPSLEVLREVRDDEREKGSTRVLAADKILDRALGKPTLHVETDNTTRNVPADLQRLDRELDTVRKQLADKGVPDGNN